MSSTSIQAKMFKAVSASTTAIAGVQTQSGAADMTLTGTSVNDGSNMSTTVTLTSASNNASVSFTIEGTDANGASVTETTGYAESIDTNYAAVYWPWVQVQDARNNGAYKWVPPSVVLGGVYSFNDKVAHPWFAPAGLNRGGIDVAVQAETQLQLMQL